MADDRLSVGMTIGTAVGGATVALFTGAGCWWGTKGCVKAYHDGHFSRGWRRVRVCTLGGVTTLGQALAYNCAMCGDSLEQREEVRTLSCGHVFHLRKGPKCGSNIDDWLRENRLRCPACRKPVHPVLPWKAPPTSAPPAAPVPLQSQSAPPRPAAPVPLQLQAQSAPSSSTSDLESQEPRRMAMEQVPPHVHRPLPRYPPSKSSQVVDAILFGSPPK